MNVQTTEEGETNTDQDAARQIRNAFQAAIALAEHDGQQIEPGKPIPTLGKAQFDIVAKSSEDFERYLLTTHGAAESDIAIREEWRADRFTSGEPVAASQAPAARQTYGPARTGIPGAKDVESDSSDSSSDEENDDDTETSNIKSVAMSAGRSGPSKEPDESRDTEYEEFQEFRRWQKRKK
jgi:hypothetical protein